MSESDGDVSASHEENSNGSSYEFLEETEETKPKHHSHKAKRGQSKKPYKNENFKKFQNDLSSSDEDLTYQDLGVQDAYSCKLTNNNIN